MERLCSMCRQGKDESEFYFCEKIKNIILIARNVILYTKRNIREFIEKGRKPMKLCSNCGKYPFCGKCYTPTDVCEDWVKQDYETKLTRVDELNYKFERIEQ